MRKTTRETGKSVKVVRFEVWFGESLHFWTPLSFGETLSSSSFCCCVQLVIRFAGSDLHSQCVCERSLKLLQTDGVSV